MFETCIVCREVPPMSGESYCEVCIKTLDNAPASTVEFAQPQPQAEKSSADGSPTQSGEPPVSVEVEEEFDEPSGSEILRVTPKNTGEKILRHSA